MKVTALTAAAVLFGCALATNPAQACGGSSSRWVSHCIGHKWSGNSQYLYNKCSKVIEAVWCHQGDPCASRTGRDRFSNSWSIRPGGQWRLGTRRPVLRFNACRYSFQE